MDSPLGPARRRLDRVTQEAMASRLGVSASTISKWERNEQRPDPILAGPIAAEYRIPEADVVAWIGYLTRNYVPRDSQAPTPSVAERLDALEAAVRELQRDVERLTGRANSGDPS